MEKQLVIFKLANEYYGVDIAAVETIIKPQTITAVPFAPRHIKGMINLRGTVLPVIDLRQSFGLSLAEPDIHTRIVVIETNGFTLGMIVDAVAEVLRVSDESIEPPSSLLLTVDSAFITGIAKLGERLVLLLDLGKILSGQDQVNLSTVSQIAATSSLVTV